MKADQEKEQDFNEVAYLAVRTHVHHQYTDYDDILFGLTQGIGRSDEARNEARKMVADKIEEILEHW
jgi:hypothetical protein